MIVFVDVVFLSDLLRNILKCNCSPYSTMRKVYLVKVHVVYVYWIDTVYVQNNLPTEFSKRTVFII